MSIIGACYKLISNSSYGSLLMDKTKHTSTVYTTDVQKVSSLVNSTSFKDLDEFPNEMYEAESYKHKISIDNPIQIGFFILQYAKLRMLEFYYDCLTKYLTSNSFELIETDTDSMYMALNKPTLEQCVKKELLTEFKGQIYSRCSDDMRAEWFPRKCCEKHIAFDRRYCGIFGLEFKGYKMVALCSKSYIIEDEYGKQKISCKGISKKAVDQPMEKFENTLTSTVANTSHNVGFRLNNGEMYTYDQTKIGFNYFYCKREVMSDGVSTKPLNLLLCPWEQDVTIVSQIHDPMSNLYECNITLECGMICKSVEQAYCYLLTKFCDDIDLSNQISLCTESLLVRELCRNIVEPKEWMSERLEHMKYLLDLKLMQCNEFKSALMSTQNNYLVYKQHNFSKKDVLFWSVSHNDRLIKVLPPDSMVGNNNMGILLSSIRDKLKT